MGGGIFENLKKRSQIGRGRIELRWMGRSGAEGSVRPRAHDFLHDFSLMNRAVRKGGGGVGEQI